MLAHAMNTALASAFAFLTLTSFQSDAVELGTVDWLRDLDVALTQAKAKQKPVFTLFQEVPG